MSRNEAEIILSASETKLVQGLRRGETAVKTYGQKTMEIFKRTGAAIGRVSDRYLTRFNTLLGGAGLVMAGKSVIDFDAKLARLSIVAGLTKQQMFGLKAELFDVAKATHQAPTDLLDGVNAIVERTGNFKFAVESLKNMGIVASATGARMEDIGASASNMQEKMGITQDQVMSVFDVLNEQGKKGAFTLQNMASLFERLLSAANRFDVKGVDGMRKFGAFLQIARRGAGTSDMAATAVESTFSDIIGKAKDLQSAGIQIFDPEKSKKAGRDVFRDFDLVIKDIIVKSKGSSLVLSKIFEDRSIRAITPLVQSWKKFGDFREFDEFAKTGGSGVSILKDFGFWSEQSAAKIVDFKSEMSKLANENLAGPIRVFTRALTALNEHPVATKGGLYAILGLGGILTAGKVIGGVRDVFGKKGLPGLGGGLAGAGTPVFVTNMPGSGISGAGGANSGLGTRDVDFSKSAPTAAAGLTGAAAWGVASIPLLIGAGSFAVSRMQQRESAGLKQWRAENPYDYAKSREVMGGKPADNKINLNVYITPEQIRTDTDDLNTRIAVTRGDLR
jgi:TP901 family phage tail tape measure protein